RGDEATVAERGKVGDDDLDTTGCELADAVRRREENVPEDIRGNLESKERLADDSMRAVYVPTTRMIIIVLTNDLGGDFDTAEERVGGKGARGKANVE
ncbi:13898_t:CDS:2, partial [Acaulospora colombiana]